MKAYKDYMDSISISDKWQKDTINKLNAAYICSNKSYVPKALRVALFAAIICITLSATAFAVVSYIWEHAERADTGGRWVMVPVEADYYEKEGISLAKALYCFDQCFTFPIFDEESMLILNDLLKDNVFTEDGEPFNLFIPVAGGYQAADRGYSLFDTLGNGIGEIYYVSLGHQGKPIAIEVITIEISIRNHNNYVDTYEDASIFIGQSFRLPTIYIDSFSPPVFKIQDDYYINRYSVYINYEGEPGMYFFVEKTRTDSYEEWVAPGAVITATEMAGTTVYKISDDCCNRYTWEYNGLTYMFFQFFDTPKQFTDEQVIEIIISMIE